MNPNMATTGKIDRRVAKTQKAIRAAFRTLLLENGIEKVTVSALARKADIDRKTFYLHFPSIDALVEQEAAEVVRRVAHALSTPAENPEANLTLSLQKVLRELAAIAEEDAPLYRHVISSFSIDQMVDALFEPVKHAVQENDVTHNLPQGIALDYLLRFYIAGTLAVFTQWFMHDRTTPLDSIVEVVAHATSIHHESAASARAGALR